MKKLLFVLLLVASFYGTASAQGFFIRVGGGYNFSFAGDVIGVNSEEICITTNEYYLKESADVILGSRAESFTTGIRVGYFFTKHIGADVGFNYNFGRTFEYKWSSYQKNITRYVDKEDLTTWGSSGNSSTNANSLLFTPSFIISTDQEKNWNIYTRLGIAIAVPTIYDESSVYFRHTVVSTNLPPVTSMRSRELKEETRTKVGLGFSGAVGAEYHFGQHFGIYGEINILAMSLTPSESEYTRYIENGNDILNQLPEYRRKTKYVSNLSREIRDPNSTSEERMNAVIGRLIQYNSLGFNVGVKYRF